MTEEFLDDNVVKAIVRGVKYNDFTHWKRLKDRNLGPTFFLDIGYGYRLVANARSRYLDDNEYQIFHRGKFMFCSYSDMISLAETGIYMSGKCYDIRLKYDAAFDIERYARSIEKKVRKNRVIFKDKDEGPISTDVFYTEDEKYWGITKKKKTQAFDEGFKDALMDAVKLQKYSGLKEYSTFDVYKESPFGPAHITFTCIDKAEYSSDIHVSVFDSGRVPVELRMKGVLTSDDDGIVIRGTDAAYTIVLKKHDIKRFEKNHPELVTMKEYIEEHPLPSYKDIIKGKEEHIMNLLYPGNSDYNCEEDEDEDR